MSELPAEWAERKRTAGGDILVLVASRLRQIRNAVDQQLRDAPWRVLSAVGLLVLIWTGLYFLLAQILHHLGSWGLVGIVALEQVLAHFFLVLAVMLAFSNAILTFSTLFGRSEPACLLASPLHARSVVFVKWVEGLLLSSWSFLLLGVPLMAAIAKTNNVEWHFYPLFLAHFIGFVTIPASVGLLCALAVALWAPRRPLAIAIGLGGILVIVAVYWLARISQHALESEEWLRMIFNQVDAVRQPLLPPTWTAKGIADAVEQSVPDSLFYLGIVTANGFFLAWLTINVLASRWAEAYSCAQLGRFHPTIRRGWLTEVMCWGLFFYLPRAHRLLMLKDLRGLTRDARQWSQMVIMFALLIVYVLNLKRFPIEFGPISYRGLIAYLNLTVVSLILATFTSRFLYPLLSLESQQLWLLELLPVGRVAILTTKFLFAFTLTGLSGLAVMTLAARVLELPEAWARANVIACLSVCIGLSGLSIGLGARFPVLGNRNPARIAAGFGGTFNLIASMLFVAAEMGGVLLIASNELSSNLALTETISTRSELLLVGLLLFGIATAGVALWQGARHFERLEY